MDQARDLNKLKKKITHNMKFKLSMEPKRCKVQRGWTGILLGETDSNKDPVLKWQKTDGSGSPDCGLQLSYKILPIQA